ncbi:MAG: O-antigen ligase family protein [Deltaproteobacteria bacterium]|nr:O-antigen ligase family protein [Deltaproteobacteria bacterium]
MDPDSLYHQHEDSNGVWPTDTRQSIPLSIIFVLPFVLSAISIALMPGFNRIVIGLGVLAFFVFCFYSIRAGFLMTPELKCLIAYFVFATMGIFVAKQPQIFFIKYRTTIQILLMTVMILNYSRSTGMVKLIFFTVFLGCVVVAASAVWTGDYARAETEGERVAGFAVNANSFAINLIFATMISLYFFKAWKSWFLKIGLIGLILVFGRLILASGSRKGFIGFMATLFFWFLFSYGAQIKKKPFAFVMGLIVVVSIAGLFYVWSKGSLVEERFGKRVEEDVRIPMYISGFKIIASHPLLGVGLDSYRLYAPFGTYSHSTYIEVFSGTGVFGGLAYYSIYVVLWFRLWRLGKYPLRLQEQELVAIGKMFIVLRCMLDFVTVSYADKLNWIFFAVLIGWTYSMERQLKEESQSQLMDEYPDYESEPYPADPEIAYSQEGYPVE